MADTLPTTRELRSLLSEKLAKLKESLASNNSVGFDLSTELRYIHATLKSNPAIGYMLSDEEIGIITKGFSIETSIVLVAPKVKVAKAAIALSIDDI
jgi:hypothetical protein